jgi:LPS O-antigen subunit length determinant protein (WzzB/FepE family)
MALTVGDEDKRKEAMELFIRALQAAPDSFIKALSGKNYAEQLIAGATEFKGYLFPDKK